MLFQQGDSIILTILILSIRKTILILYISKKNYFDIIYGIIFSNFFLKVFRELSSVGKNNT